MSIESELAAPPPAKIRLAGVSKSFTTKRGAVHALADFVGSGGTLVMVGAKGGSLLGPLGHFARLRLAALRGSQKAVFFAADLNRRDLDVLRELLESGSVKPVVEQRYELSDVADALRYMGEGHARGKLVINI